MPVVIGSMSIPLHTILNQLSVDELTECLGTIGMLIKIKSNKPDTDSVQTQTQQQDIVENANETESTASSSTSKNNSWAIKRKERIPCKYCNKVLTRDKMGLHVKNGNACKSPKNPVNQ